MPDLIFARLRNLIMQAQQYSFDSQHWHVIQTLLNSIAEISLALQHSPVIKLETVNKFGDEQLHQDVHCDELVEKHLRLNPTIKSFASQERPEHLIIGEGEGYCVTYDPLDGSSIIDTNFSVGSIFTIWKHDEKGLVGAKLSSQVSSILSVYGPRTTVILYNPKADKVQEITLLDNKWILSHDHLVIKPQTKMFSPGNLRAATENKEYRQIVDGWIEKGYTLRYTGGLVPDAVQIFIKGHGIFCNVASQSHKSKLRVLYEVAAIGFLIEKAGGKTVTVGRTSLMEIEIKGYDDRISFGAGSADEVAMLSKLF